MGILPTKLNLKIIFCTYASDHIFEIKAFRDPNVCGISRAKRRRECVDDELKCYTIVVKSNVSPLICFYFITYLKYLIKNNN